MLGQLGYCAGFCAISVVPRTSRNKEIKQESLEVGLPGSHYTGGNDRKVP